MSSGNGGHFVSASICYLQGQMTNGRIAHLSVFSFTQNNRCGYIHIGPARGTFGVHVHLKSNLPWNIAFADPDSNMVYLLCRELLCKGLPISVIWVKNSAVISHSRILPKRWQRQMVDHRKKVELTMGRLADIQKVLYLLFFESLQWRNMSVFEYQITTNSFVSTLFWW